MPSETDPKPRRFRSALALGFRLAGAGFMQKLSLAIAAVTVLGAIAVAVALLQGEAPPIAEMPGLTASALAWGGGFTFAIAAAARAFDHDATSGVRALAHARGVTGATYVAGRVFGLAIALALMVAVGALVTGGACAILAPASRVVILKSTAVTLPYALAFGLVLAPLAAATLGSRSRSGGYLLLLAIVVLPELAQDSLDTIPARWRSLVGLPSAMATLRDALTPGHIDGALAGAAAAVLFVAALIALLFSLETASHAARVESPG